MARNGSGVYSPPAANYPAVSGTLITSADRNAIDADIATALTNSIATNGESVVTNDIPFGNNKLTGVAAGTAATDAATLSQVQSGGSSLLASVTGADTITATLSPSLTAYASGQLFKLIPANTNTGAVTLNINGLGAKSITKNGVAALVAGDLVAGSVYLVEYDGTRFQTIALQVPYLPLTGGPLTGLLNISSTTAGQIQFPATQNASANANTLDDYEEGTWTPVLTFTTPGNLNIVYSTASGFYTKIGREVITSFAIQTSTFTHTTASGAARITGAPFTSTDPNQYGTLGWQGITIATHTSIIWRPVGGTSLDLLASGSGQNIVNISQLHMPSGGNVVLIGQGANRQS